ncbi:MAG TPA: hypothetical protein VGL61_18540 [Kofleriaceae bacterium]
MAFLAAACGGHKQADTTPDTNPNTTETPPPDESGNMLSPDKMDEVNNDLKRKEMIISRCLADAMEAGEVPRGTHGHIRFEIKIGTDGHATDVHVDKTDIQANSVIECAKKHITDIEFPTLAHAYETSYLYAMEAN